MSYHFLGNNHLESASGLNGMSMSKRSTSNDNINLTSNPKGSKSPSSITSSKIKKLVTKKNKKVYAWKRPADKPKRPACAYNLFFYLERERILRGDYNQNSIYSSDDVIRSVEAQTYDKPKRKHVKTHGMISFTELSKMIALNWKGLDKKGREVFEYNASLQSAEYANKLVEWKEKNERKLNDTRLSYQYSDENLDSDNIPRMTKLYSFVENVTELNCPDVTVDERIPIHNLSILDYQSSNAALWEDFLSLFENSSRDEFLMERISLNDDQRFNQSYVQDQYLQENESPCLFGNKSSCNHINHLSEYTDDLFLLPINFVEFNKSPPNPIIDTFNQTTMEMLDALEDEYFFALMNFIFA